MSIYKNQKSPFWQFDFQISNRRFYGSTETGDKKAALAFEREAKAKARASIEAEKHLGAGPLTLDIAAGRFWQEVGQYHSGSATEWRDLKRLIDYFSPDKRLDEMSDGDVAALVAWRRQHTIKGRKKDKAGKSVQLIANATVNRSTTIVLKKLFTRAKRVWRHQFPHEPSWRDHWLKEAGERVREVHAEESEALDASVRADYEPWLEFARVSGLRLAETLIRWPEVDWLAKIITTKGKGGRTVTTPITSTVAAILAPLKGHHPEFVFTYICRRPRGKKRIRGQRYPITYSGAKSEWKRHRTRAKVKNLRFHDLRHDVATKLLRQTGNLKLVQKALNHADIKTTLRYAHVLNEEVAAGLEGLSKSRNKSLTVKPKSA